MTAAVPRLADQCPPPLGGHRLLGSGRGAALLQPDGEIDWWCPDRFDATTVRCAVVG